MNFSTFADFRRKTYACSTRAADALLSFARRPYVRADIPLLRSEIEYSRQAVMTVRKVVGRNSIRNVAVAGLLFLVLFVFMARPNTENRSPAGPETLKLCQEMKPYELGGSMAFLNRFGGPDNLAHAKLDNREVTFYTYRCADGEVSVMNDDTDRLIVRVDPQGKLIDASHTP